jgi:hypothetical protein
VRDLPLAGRVTHLVWRKRRYGCAGCGRTFTECHPELPPASLRAAARRRRARRGRPRRADDALPGRACLPSGRGGRARGPPRSAAGAAAVARRSPPPPRPRTGHGRLRPRPRVRRGGARRSLTAAGRALPALAARGEPARDRGRLDRPLRGLPPGDPQRAAVGPDRGRPLPPRSAAPTPRSTRSGGSASATTPAAGRRGRAARVRAPAGGRTSTAPATGYSRPASG